LMKAIVYFCEQVDSLPVIGSAEDGVTLLGQSKMKLGV
jgi:hypothetical protein